MRTVLLAVFVAACASGCGGAGKLTEHAGTTLSTTLSAVNAARDGFVKWDETHQLQIVDAASTREDAEAELATYRAERQKVVVAFAIAYGSIAAAAAAVPLVDAGEKSPADLVALLAKAGEAVQAAINVYADLQKAQAGVSSSGVPARVPPPLPDPPPSPES